MSFVTSSSSSYPSDVGAASVAASGALTPEQISTVATIRRSVAIVDLIAAIAHILLFLYLRRKKAAKNSSPLAPIKYSTRMILYLQCSLAGLACSRLLTFETFTEIVNGTDSGVCVLQGWSDQFFLWMAAGYTVFIFIFIYCRCVLEMQLRFPFYSRLSHGVIWSWALLCSLIPFSINLYGPAGGWCWFNVLLPGGAVATFALLYGPIWVLFAAIVVCFIQLWRTISRAESGLSSIMDATQLIRLKETRNRVLHNLAAFPIIWLICWIVPTLHRLQQLLLNDDSYVLTTIHSFCLGIQAEFTFCVYLWQLWKKSKRKKARQHEQEIEMEATSFPPLASSSSARASVSEFSSAQYVEMRDSQQRTNSSRC